MSSLDFSDSSHFSAASTLIANKQLGYPKACRKSFADIDNNNDSDEDVGYMMRDVRAQRIQRILVWCVVVLAILCLSLVGAVVKLSVTPKDVFRHVPEAKAEIIHTPGVMPPILGPECKFEQCVNNISSIYGTR